MRKEFLSSSKEETQDLGKKLALLCKSGDVILLQGDLGAGKTAFVGGAAQGLDIEENVISPTFNIMKCYFGGSLPLYHIDAYRLEDQNIELGLDEYIEGDGVCFIEWPKFIEPLLPDERMEITISHLGGDKRKLVFEAKGPHFEDMLKELK